MEDAQTAAGSRRRLKYNDKQYREGWKLTLQLHRKSGTALVPFGILHTPRILRGEAMRTLQRRAEAFATSVMCLLSLGAAYGATNLRVSANGHYIETADGEPFLYLNDTEWIVYKHPDDEILRLLDDRQKKGFTVIKISTCGLNYHYGVDSEDHNGNRWYDNRQSDAAA
jgi:hypothetical protein